MFPSFFCFGLAQEFLDLGFGGAQDQALNLAVVCEKNGLKRLCHFDSVDCSELAGARIISARFAQTRASIVFHRKRQAR